MQPWEQDMQFQAHEVGTVEPATNGWSVGFVHGWHLFVTSDNVKEPPTPGEPVLLFGRGIGYPVRGIVIGGRVYRYQGAAEHEVEQSEMRAHLTREREEADAKFVAAASRLPPLPKFECTDPDGWAACVKLNSSDAYSYECCRYAAAWASLMESAGPFTPESAEECASKADTGGITGFMYGAAVAMLAKFWAHGDKLRRWHNGETQIGDEGDRANETGGVLNPALLSVGE